MFTQFERENNLLANIHDLKMEKMLPFFCREVRFVRDHFSIFDFWDTNTIFLFILEKNIFLTKTSISEKLNWRIVTYTIHTGNQSILLATSLYKSHSVHFQRAFKEFVSFPLF